MTQTQTEVAPDLTAQIAELVTYINETVIKPYYAEHYKNIPHPDFVTAEYGGGRWCRLVKKTPGLEGGSAYGFICLESGYTKTLGHLTAGDIHKPAGWKAPAKHRRGSVLDKATWNCAGPHGMAYLR